MAMTFYVLPESKSFLWINAIDEEVPCCEVKMLFGDD